MKMSGEELICYFSQKQKQVPHRPRRTRRPLLLELNERGKEEEEETKR